ncbi:uncharacterized protein LOC132613059 [Lycium barbarum]|uniref:uncharacterized protein LOC132613059 n=1 Tax=Lycium barbarum TaxID=112863 RepID=UPI00293F0A79|nr:uncharacterized protein LOC132613059 [Lycium barbarum]
MGGVVRIRLGLWENTDVEILEDTAQQITAKLFFKDLDGNVVVTMMYDKCAAIERLGLWDSLYSLADRINLPWLIGGDFNVILNGEEKIGGLPGFPQEYEDFALCVNSYELTDINFKGSPFTWWNGRTTQNFVKPFKFLDFWTEHKDFTDVIRQHWQATNTTDVFLSFKQKLKSVKTALSQWSKHTFGDIFKQLCIREDIVRVKEDLFEEFSTEGNIMILQRAQAELQKYLHYEEEFWR